MGLVDAAPIVAAASAMKSEEQGAIVSRGKELDPNAGTALIAGPLLGTL